MPHGHSALPSLRFSPRAFDFLQLLLSNASLLYDFTTLPDLQLLNSADPDFIAGSVALAYNSSPKFFLCNPSRLSYLSTRLPVTYPQSNPVLPSMDMTSQMGQFLSTEMGRETLQLWDSRYQTRLVHP